MTPPKERPTYNKDARIIIIGAGVFGLSSALHLADKGYTNITVFDRLDFNAINYSFLEGADTASADINKFFRAFYADKFYYQKLAYEAADVWEQWEKLIRLLPDEEARKYPDLKIFERCGILRLDDVVGNCEEERQNLEGFEKQNLRATQFDINDPDDVMRAKATGWSRKLDPLGLKERGKVKFLSSVLDSTGGILYASRACMFCKYLAAQKGVRFVFGAQEGTIKNYIYKDKEQTEVGGIITNDNKEHLADLVIVSAGPWSTQLVPELDGINEATSGTVVILRIPPDRKDLLEKYSPRNFPIVSWKMGHSREKSFLGGVALFPALEPSGVVKLLVRQVKYTNPTKLSNGRVVSIPKTTNSTPSEFRITKHTIEQIKAFVLIACPDLVEAGINIEATRLLWYTDTINNDFIIDYVPGKKNLVVTTGGSGHAFKFLPVIGRFTVDVIEGHKTEYTEKFKWRKPEEFDEDVNGLKEGLDGPRNYNKQKLSSKEDYIFHNIKENIEKITLFDDKIPSKL